MPKQSSGSSAHRWGTAPEFIGPRHRFREDLLLRALIAAQPGRKVLNIGAGQGTFTNRLHAKGFEVTSTDLSDAAVAVLRERVTGEVLQADATRLPFAASAFDAVVLGEVLEHVENEQAALAEAKRVLRPAGVLAVSVPRNPAWFSKSDEWAGHVRRYTRDHLTRQVEAAGFEITKCFAWGFPVAALYHRTVYETAVRGGAAEATGGGHRWSLSLLALLLRIDRLFIGVDRGALGYILVARNDSVHGAAA
jgi:SAM-dependent methyltransferase